MTLSVPSDGLDEIRKVWAGRGGLWGAIGALPSKAGEPWSAELARRRATRVAAELFRPHLLAWPTSTRRWVDALPAQSLRHSVTSEALGPGVDWVATRRAGWPPLEFVHRRRSRIADTVMVTTARWTIEALAEAVREIDRLDGGIVGDSARERLEVARQALQYEPLASSHPTAPTRADLTALRSSGRPWGSVAAVAASLQMLRHDPAQLAYAALDPDPALADRLFHVAVLGCLIRGLPAHGWSVAVVGLPGSPDGRPQFVVTDPAGQAWDLWFEMAGAWTYYEVPSPYAPAVKGIAGTGGALGADIALIRKGEGAVLVECKYSANPTYVGRTGYEQTLAYMAEVRTGLAREAAGVVVGPAEVVLRTGRTITSVGTLTVTSSFQIAAQVAKAATDVTASLVA